MVPSPDFSANADVHRVRLRSNFGVRQQIAPCWERVLPEDCRSSTRPFNSDTGRYIFDLCTSLGMVELNPAHRHKRRWNSSPRGKEVRRWYRYHNVSKCVYKDSKNRDRKRGLDNDLTLEFVQQELTKGCHYCGGRDGRMTLDRMDSTIGHLQSNVVPSCERCNILKKDMPFEAWLMIVPAIKEAFERGLFGSWVGGPHSKRRQLPPPTLSRPIASVLHGRKADKPSKPVKASRYPSPTELANLLQTKPATEIAKGLGVSSTALKKHCKRVGVETPPRGYWRAKEAAEVPKEDLQCKGCLTPITKAATTGQCSLCFNKSPGKREATRIQKTKFPTLPIDAERPRE